MGRANGGEQFDLAAAFAGSLPQRTDLPREWWAEETSYWKARFAQLFGTLDYWRSSKEAKQLRYREAAEELLARSVKAAHAYDRELGRAQRPFPPAWIETQTEYTAAAIANGFKGNDFWTLSKRWKQAHYNQQAHLQVLFTELIVVHYDPAVHGS